MADSRLIRLFVFIGCVATAACGDPTAPAALPVHGATYELVTVGRPACSIRI